MGEFDLIRRYFTPATYSADVCLGVGDDAAVLSLPNDQHLVAAVDTIVAGVHFPESTLPADIGRRALAVNLSDLAAMGATPRWFTLSLSLPQAEEVWLQGFARGLFELAEQHQIQLVGGDTVKGPLNISVQVLGSVERDGWLQRSRAQVGDLLCVTGSIGDAAAGLALAMQANSSSISSLNEAEQFLLQRFLRPTPRVSAGRALRSIASAAMDISDGLLTDTRKLCVASGVGAQIHLEQLPLTPALRRCVSAAQAERHALGGGDDYELLFTVSPARWPEVQAALAALKVPVTIIGDILAAPSNADDVVRCLRQGEVQAVVVQGYDHFSVATS